VISHHKCMGQRNFGRSRDTLALISQARRSQRVALDVYPYDASSTMLSSESVAQASRTVVSWSDTYPDLAGRDLVDAARHLGCSSEQAVSLLSPAGGIYFCMHEDDLIRIVSFDGVMIGSDGLPEDKHPHPRLWGTFPRVLARYVREQRVLTLEQAVRRMSGLCADEYGLGRRGYLRVGNFADLCVFDADTITDMATYVEPKRPAGGIRAVLVNGQLAVSDGSLTGCRAGRVLRHTYK
jgi:N-acyl-D-amino-acid deacylase